MRVGREELLQRLESVSPGLAVRETLAQATCLIFRGGRVWTFDEEICCRTKTGLPDEVAGAAPGKPLLEILKRLTEESLDVTVEKGQLLFTGKGRRAAVSLDPNITSPIASLEKPAKWRRLPPEFLEALDLVQRSASADNSRFDLTCVHMTPTFMEACDQFQLVRYKIKTGVSEEVLVSRAAVKHATAFGMSEMTETENWMHFRNGAGLYISCRRYADGVTYPDMTPLIDWKREGSVTLPKGLPEACARAEVFSGEDRESNFVKVALSPGRLRVQGRGGAGWYSETKKVAYKGPPMEFLVRPGLLARVCEHGVEADLRKENLRVNGGAFAFVMSFAQDDNAVPPADGKKEKKAARSED